jgi:hypothetical protein
MFKVQRRMMQVLSRWQWRKGPWMVRKSKPGFQAETWYQKELGAPLYLTAVLLLVLVSQFINLRALPQRTAVLAWVEGTRCLQGKIPLLRQLRVL